MGGKVSKIGLHTCGEGEGVDGAPDGAGSSDVLPRETRAEGRPASFLHDAMAHVQLLQIEIQNLKDALDASQKKANRYSQIGASGHCRSAIRTD